MKRMMDSKCILTMNNWRGMWLGCIILAQKVWDDASLRTSSFASILPGVTKSHLKALEVKIFMLLNYATNVKPSIYARFYFELREIFKTITGELVQNSNPDNRGKGGRRLPLTVKNANLLKCASEDPRITPQTSQNASRARSNGGSQFTSGWNTGTQSRASRAPAAWQASAADTASSSTAGSSAEDPATDASTALLPEVASLSLTASNLTSHTSSKSAATTASSASTHSDTLQQFPPGKHGTAASTPRRSKSHPSQAAWCTDPLSTSTWTYEDHTYTKSSRFVIS